MPAGRPSSYNAQVAEAICDELAAGKSLRRVCDNPIMPERKTVLNWLSRGDKGESPYDLFLRQYTRAKDEGADALADDISDIAEEVRAGLLEPNAGRVAGDLKKWSASKLKPKKYGDKLDLTSAGKELPTPIFGGLSVPKDTSGDMIEDVKSTE